MQVLKVTARQINNFTCRLRGRLRRVTFFYLLLFTAASLRRLGTTLCASSMRSALRHARRYSGGRVVKADPISMSAAQDYEILQYKLNFTSAQMSWGRIRRLRLWCRSVNDDKSGHNLKAFLTMSVLIVVPSRLPRTRQVNKNTDK